MIEWPWAAIVTGTVATVSSVGFVVRYAFKLERSFNEQHVINEKHIAAVNGVLEKLNGHCVLDDSREDRVDRIEDRLARVEQGIALHTR